MRPVPKKILFESAVHQLLSAVRRGRGRLAEEFKISTGEIDSIVDDVTFTDLGSRKMKLQLNSRSDVEFEIDYAGAQFYGRGDMSGKESSVEELTEIASSNEVFFDACVRQVFERIVRR